MKRANDGSIVMAIALCLSLGAVGCGDDEAASDDGPDAAADVSADVSADRSRDLTVDFNAGDAADAIDAGDAAFDALPDGDGGASFDAPDDAQLDVGDEDAVDQSADDVADAGSDAQTDAGADCPAAIADLAAELYASIGACSVVVRLDYQSLERLGFQVFCSRYAAVSEEAARATAQADTGYGSAGTMLNEASPEDYYVFYEAPGDFGGAAAVSAQTGASAFGGSIIWSGTGDITYPSTWRPAGELADGCDSAGGFPGSRGWDLVAGGALSDDDLAAPLAAVEQTSVPAAFWQGGYVFDAVVLLYPRSVGIFNPATAEWIVMVSGGWLE